MGTGSRCPSPFLAVSRTVERRTHASSITGVAAGKSSAVTVGSRGRLSSKWPDRQEVQVAGRRPVASGWSSIATGGSGPTIDSPVSWRLDSALGGRTPPSASVGLVPHLRRGHCSPQPPGPRNLSRSCALSMGWRAPPREAHGAHGEEESLGVVGPEVIDSQRAGGYSPLDFPPSGGSCWASWRQARQGRNSVSGASSEVEHAAWRRIRCAGETGETPGGETSRDSKSTRKVRTER